MGGPYDLAYGSGVTTSSHMRHSRKVLVAYPRHESSGAALHYTEQDECMNVAQMEPILGGAIAFVVKSS